jgi:predicted nucleic acid-binding protein
VIVYFDTSALVPLIIAEPTSSAAVALWNGAARAVATPLAYVESHAALAQAERLGRITRHQLRCGLEELELLDRQLDRVEFTHALSVFAGEIAERHSLRAYDAVHLAGALTVGGPDLVFATADRRLATAASDAGLATAQLTTN